MHPDRAYSERSIAELLGVLSNETATLVRQEMRLARAEMMEKGKKAQAAAVSFSATALLGIAAFLALTAAIIAGLSLLMDVWIAALAVAIVYGAIALVLVQAGKRQLHDVSVVPEQTVATVQEDVEWAKTRAASDAR